MSSTPDLRGYKTSDMAWRGMGVGVNDTEKKKKHESTAFSLESVIKGIEVHTPMYLPSTKRFIPQYFKKKKNIHSRTYTLSQT